MPATLDENAPIFTAADFAQTPDLECDVVMKGGLTSGVIYPWAVCELARTYRLRSLGGASAGAIAAAAAAAAEYGRQTGTVSPGADPATADGGFLGLSRFPEQLMERQPSGRSLLFDLFRPQEQTKRLFELVTAGLDDVARLPRTGQGVPVAKLILGTLLRSARWAPGRTLLGLLPGLLLAALGVIGLTAAENTITVLVSVLTLLFGLIVAAIGVIVGVVAAFLGDVKELPAVGFGITAGRGPTDHETALTPWLHRRFQQLAGRPDGPPLTFGDLREHGIDLQVMTTNLSRKQPLTMPWQDWTYFFEPAEFEQLFGPEILGHLLAHPPEAPVDLVERRRWETLVAQAGTRKPFPHPDQLPIIVATRMSLSFPVLITAIPLYAVDWSRPANRAYREQVDAWWASNPDGSAVLLGQDLPRPVFEKNWFSDGGLTSNLPVQFFDSPLPRRPTFAIDLAEFNPERPRQSDEAANSWLPTGETEGTDRRTTRWRTDKPLTALVSFGVSLVSTARNWVDESNLVMPGYRDRVVTIYQDDDEGGLNLSMPPDVVRRLSLRGRFAAHKLVDRYDPAGPGWGAHRWVRFRAATAAVTDWFGAFERGYDAPGVEPSYPELFERQPSYPLPKDDLDALRERTTGLRREIKRWRADADAITANRPQQPPVLKLGPRTDAAATRPPEPVKPATP